MKYAPVIVFDLDGTLVDTAPDLQTTINTLLERDDRTPVDAATMRRLVGRGARNLIAEAFRMTGAPIDAARIETLYQDFLNDYASHIAAASAPFPGVIETLDALKAAGARLGVLTNKPHRNAMQLLAELRMTGYFGAICGQGKRPWLKPDPRVFADLVQDLGGPPGGGAIMVGDSITDVETARGAGVPVILMSFGYTPEPAASLGADLVLDDFCEVPVAAASLLPR